jgi:outer membrane protein assembly factor BamE (lipoprotein component of BamABCDE complex)
LVSRRVIYGIYVEFALTVSIMKRYALCFVVLFALAGCSGAQYHRDAVSGDRKSALTVGQVQKEVRVGMSGAEVASVLGSPNVVTTDENRRETWIYDKISTERAYSSDSGGILTLIFGAGGGDGGGGGGGIFPGYVAGSGAGSQTQKTLTVIIKFDESKRVRDFAYHSSTF